jgi:putative ABC transport system substrate-binding protein
MTRLTRTLRSVLALSLAAGLTLMGTSCGNTNDKSNSGQSSTAGKTSSVSNQSASEQASTNTPEGKTYKIGIIQFAEHPSLENCQKGFVQGLEERGYKENEQYTMDYQVAQADTNLANQMAENFASKGYDLIVGIATPAAQAAYNAGLKAGIPVIFNAVTDPVAAGFQNEDGTNKKGVTGTKDILPIKNQLEMIRAFQPEAKKIGILYSLSEANSKASVDIYETLASDYGFEIVSQAISSEQDIPAAAQSLVSKVDCLTNLTDNTVVQNLQVVMSKANAAQIPYYGSEEEQVTNGCIAAEGLDYIALGIVTGHMAADILEGAAPEDVPIEQAEDSSPFINSKVMEQLGITLPEAYKDATDMAK